MIYLQDEKWFGPWNRALVEILKQIPGVQVRKEGWPKVKLGRGKFNSWFEYDGKLGSIYCWDYSHDVFTILKEANPSLLLFIQATKSWEAIDKRVQPWTMFATCHLEFLRRLPEYKTIMEMTPKTHPAGFWGRMWRNRRPWFAEMQKLKYDVGQSKAVAAEMRSFYEKVAKWEVGINLIGKYDKLSDGKNRREVEFSALKIPMVMNYQPFYRHSLTPGVHYVFSEKPGDLESSVKKAIEMKTDLVENGYRYYLEHFSPRGMQKDFLDLL